MSCVKKRRQLHLTFAQSDITKEQQASSVERQMNDFKRTVVHRSLTVKDLDQAELAVIKFCQGKRFPEELICLGKGQPVKKSCHLHKLCPQLQDGILRVGGRLNRSRCLLSRCLDVYACGRETSYNPSKRPPHLRALT